MADGSKPVSTRRLDSPPPKGHVRPTFYVALILLLAATAGIGFYVYHRTSSSASTGPQGGQAGAAQHGTPVVVATARQGDMSQYLVGIGAVDPFYTVTVHTRVDGQIMSVGFEEGQEVKKGQPLIEIDPRPYQAALLQAQGQLDKDQAGLVNARLNVQRDKEAGSAVSAQQLSTDVATEQQTDAAIKVDEAAINTAQLNVTYSHITSPIDGRIGLRLVDPGNIVHATDTTGMAVITQLQPIAVVFSLPEDDIPRVMAAMKQNPHLPVEAYDRTGKIHIASGTLVTIDNEVQVSSGTFELKARFENKDRALFPNQFVNARILVGTIHNATIVPAAGVQQGPDSNYVYVVQPDDTVQLKNVTVTQLAGNEILVAGNSAASSGEQSSIESGVSPGDVIVTDGVDRLVQGAKVSVTHMQGQGNHGGAAATAPSSSAGAGAWGHDDSTANAPGNENLNVTADSNGTGAAMWQHRHQAATDPSDSAGSGAMSPETDQSAEGDATQHHHHHHPTSGPANDAGGADGSGG